MDYSAGDYISFIDFNCIKRQSEGFGILTGLVVEPYASSLAVVIGTGTAVIGYGTYSTFSTNTSSVTLSLQSNAAYPRKAVICMNSAGVLTASLGSASTAVPLGRVGRQTEEPYPPTIPSSSVQLAQIWIPAGASSGNDLIIYSVDRIGGSFWGAQ